MKKLIPVLALAVLFTACKKETVAPVNPPANSEKNLVKSQWIPNTGTPETEEYTYDNTGRVTRISYIIDDTYEVFEYPGNALVKSTNRAISNDFLINTTEAQMDAAGRIVSSVTKDRLGNETGRTEYTYNAEGYLVTQKGISPAFGYSYEFNIVNGVLVSSKYYNGNGVLQTTTEFTTDLSKPNKGQSLHGGRWLVKKLFGNVCKGLITESKTFNTAGTLTWHVKTTWETDAEGYPVKRKVENLTNGRIIDITDTYQ
ncbi:MAG: hypothetical protein JNM14_12370 [Ferruginibacter sp.]|nr:hypothetical protein [Ferruginibacter sp.]